jgi:hypothetical protein
MTTLIKLTADFNPANGSFSPVKRYNINERISYRGGRPTCHIYNNPPAIVDNSHTARLERYACRCLEVGIKPFHYTCEEFNSIMNDIIGEENASAQAAKFEADYIY